MIPFNRRSVAVIVFTALIIALVNLAWWLFYAKTEESFEYQLTRRLEAIARLGASGLKPELVISLAEGYLSAYDSTLEVIENVQQVDSLSEVFIINPDYEYLATTLLEADSVYYLAALNSIYIDSVFSQTWPERWDVSVDRTVVTDGYRVGDVVLKSAFAPLYDTLGGVAAVLGVEADVDYTDVLLDLKNNLYLSTVISIGGGLLFGLFFLLIQRRINAAEKSLFLSQSQANLGRMVAVVSHEIKNPLMIIRASAERLQKGGMKEANFIIEETDRLNSIVTGYLDFASGRKVLSKEKVNLNEFLSSIVEQFRPRLAADGVVLSLNKNDRNQYVVTDPTALRQVVINLVLNGADAVQGSEKASVIVACRMTDERGIIEVSDNGTGIDKKQLKNIFEPFYTTKTTGSGLGLFLSRRLVREMKGDMTVRSSPGEPTTFSITLPTADKG